MKRAAAVFAGLIIGALALEAQQMTAVGICNYTQVMQASYKETQAMRELDDFRLQYQKELLALVNEISDLENQKLEADKAGNREQSLQLERSISGKKTYMEDFRRIRTETYNAKAAKLLTGPIVTEINDAISSVAEKEGFALVLRTDGPTAGLILYNIPEIDITEKVIARMLEMGKR